ncbi:hypothetical protein M011DRAFT_470836 [Sporormia fimetaria CBS 119925]|uniref:Uncharacterized protein n=1 Tax=Sporormia fimetaria CBS 119925 TaxID=1340428 RepID=A0A6A6V276_9PLEO|nr:hypothetical protein M011DRAFT_470836 [Sporormia fimetaria CBS 119925]
MNSMAFRGGLSQPLKATLRSGKTIYRSRGYEHVIDQPMAKAEDQYRALSPLHRRHLQPRGSKRATRRGGVIYASEWG